jgi:hypothetical protein
MQEYREKGDRELEARKRGNGQDRSNSDRSRADPNSEQNTGEGLPKQSSEFETTKAGIARDPDRKRENKSGNFVWPGQLMWDLSAGITNPIIPAALYFLRFQRSD